MKKRGEEDEDSKYISKLWQMTLEPIVNLDCAVQMMNQIQDLHAILFYLASLH